MKLVSLSNVFLLFVFLLLLYLPIYKWLQYVSVAMKDQQQTKQLLLANSVEESGGGGAVGAANVMKKVRSARGGALLIHEATDFIAQRNRNSSKKAIYFFDVTKGTRLLGRHMCAVEAAATIHPDYDIYLIFVPPPLMKKDRDSANVTVLMNEYVFEVVTHLTNIHLLWINVTKYVADTRTGNNVTQVTVEELHFPQIVNALRYLTLYKFGGAFVDFNIVLIHTLNNLGNFVYEGDVRDQQEDDDTSLLSRAIGFEPSHPLALELFHDAVAQKSRGLGPVMNSFCKLGRSTSSPCDNVQVLTANIFFPIAFNETRRYFMESEAEFVLSRVINQTYYGFTIDANFETFKDKADVNLKQPLSLLAQTTCPRAYWSCDVWF